MKKYFEEMNQMDQLILFLGNEMFFPMLNKTKRYQSNQKY